MGAVPRRCLGCFKDSPAVPGPCLTIEFLLDRAAVTLTTESLGSLLAVAGTKTLPGIAAKPVLDVSTAASVVFSLLEL